MSKYDENWNKLTSFQKGLAVAFLIDFKNKLKKENNATLSNLDNIVVTLTTGEVTDNEWLL